MKKPTPLICLCFLLTINLFGQRNNELRGKVLYLNSSKQPAVGVKIAGSIAEEEQANIVYSNPSGSFALVFQEARDGHKVSLSIGGDDADGNALELVNAMEVDQCRIPAHVTDVFEIIVCQKGARDLVAQRYYKILRTSTDREMKKLQRRVEQMILAKEKDYQLISVLTQKIGKIEQQTDSISLYREAFRIASINKDNANSRVIKYLDLLDEGKSIQEARGVLSKEKAAKTLRESIDRIDASIEELAMKARASFSLVDYQEALSCYDTIINFLETLGVKSERLAYFYQESASVHAFDGQLKKALAYQENSVSILNSTLSKDDPRKVLAYNNLALYHSNLANYDQALSYQLKAIGIQEKILDTTHFNRPILLSVLGRIYFHKGQQQKALTHMLKALEMIRHRPEGNAAYLISNLHNDLGVVYRNIGKFKEAIDHQLQAIAQQEKQLGLRHPELGTSYDNIGLSYFSLGDFSSALSYQEKAVDIFEVVLHDKHPDLAAAYNNIANTLSSLQQHDKALEYQEQAIKIQEEVLGRNHPTLANSYSNLGISYFEFENYNKALEYCIKAVKIEEKVYSPDHPTLAGSYNNISSICEKLERDEEAMQYLEKAITIWEIALEPDHPNLATAYSNIGLLYEKDLQFDQALGYYTKAIDIQLAILGPKHLSLGISYSNVAFVYRALEQNEKALDVSLKAHEIIEQVVNAEHPFLAKVKGGLGLSYAKMGNLEDAKKAFESYEQVYENTFQNYRNWTMYFAILGKKEEAITHLQKAIDLGFKNIYWLKHDSSIDNIRGHREFKRMLKVLVGQ